MTQKIPTLEMKTGDEIPQLGMGTYRLKGDEGLEAIKNALEMGYNHIDTAEMYDNEEIVGEAISQYDRSKLFITSKVWPTNLHYEDVLEACNSTLNRLDTSYLDLFLIHWPKESIPVEESLEAMKDLRKQGKVRNVGVSNFNISQLEEAIEVHDVPINVNQVEFHPWYYRKELLDFCKENGIILTAYMPLARTEVFESEIIQNLAKSYGKTPAQVVLRWEVQKNIVVIPCSSCEEHQEKNMEIFDWKLDENDVKRIDGITREEIFSDPLIHPSHLPPTLARFLDNLPF